MAFCDCCGGYEGTIGELTPCMERFLECLRVLFLVWESDPEPEPEVLDHPFHPRKGAPKAKKET